jgi:ribonuclease HI
VAKQKYYVVWVGRETGIFTDWGTTQPLVNGYPAQYKGYDTIEEAEAALVTPPSWVNLKADASVGDGETNIKPKTKRKPKIKIRDYPLDPAFDVHIFCDGGCSPNPGPAGSGLVVYHGGKLSEMWHGCYEEMGTNNTAELNAIYQALLITEGKLEQNLKVQVLSDSTYSVKAMNQWSAKWKREGWKSSSGEEIKNKDLVIKMYEIFSPIRRRMNLAHVKGHSGVEGNELADRLCLLGIRGKVVGFEQYDGLDKVSELLEME